MTHCRNCGQQIYPICKDCLSEQGLPSDSTATCKWKKDEFSVILNTGCNNVFNPGDITLDEFGFKYCPFCGKVIEPC